MVQFGLSSTPSQYRRLIQRFVKSYLGNENKTVPFGGRRSQLAQMNAWFADHDGPANLLVTADAGRGKTALLVRWLEQLNTDVHKIFLPISIRYETNRPAFFYQALAARLADIAGETLTTSATDAGAHYRERVIEYCDLLERRDVQCLLVIDGLDEANGWSFSESVLGDISTETMRIVAAARLMVGDADEQGWLRRLGWSHRGTRAASILIPPLQSDEIADVLRRTTARFEKLSENTDVLDSLKRLTKGDPLLLTYYVEDLDELGSADSEHVLDHLRGKTEGFGAFFDDWLLKQGGLISDPGVAIEDQSIKKILAVLASALGPLPLCDLEALVARAFGNDALISRDTLQPLNRFIIGDGHQNGFALCHPKLRDFLRQDYFGSSSIVTSADDAFLIWGQQTIAAIRDDGADPSEASRYLRRHYAQHLNEADVALERYFDLIDLGWRRAWEADQEGDGLRGFKNDAMAAFEAFQHAYLESDGHSAIALVGMVSASLTLSVINSLSDNIPDDLIAEALKRNCIALGQALMFAQRSSITRTMESMGMLLQIVPEARRAYIFDTALETLRTATREGEVQHGVAAIAPFSDKEQQIDILDLATALKSEWRLAGSIQGLAPYAVPQSIEIMIGECARMCDMWPRANALLALARSSSGAVIEVLAKEAGTISDPEARTKTLTYLAQNAKGAQRETLIDDALKWSSRIKKNHLFVAALASIMEMRPNALDDDMLTRLAFPDDSDLEDYREMFRCLGKHLDDAFLGAALVRCLSPSQSWIDDWEEEDDPDDILYRIEDAGNGLAHAAGRVSEAENPVWRRVYDILPTCETDIIGLFPVDFDPSLPDIVAEALKRVQAGFRRCAQSNLDLPWDSPDIQIGESVGAELDMPASEGADTEDLAFAQPHNASDRCDTHFARRDHASAEEELNALVKDSPESGMAPDSIARCLQLLPEVPDALAEKAIDAAFIAALAPTDCGDIADCCKQLSEFLSPHSIARCLRLALAANEEYSRGQALGALVPFLTDEQRSLVKKNADSMKEFGNKLFLKCVLAQDEPADKRRTLHMDFMDQIKDRDVRFGIEAGAELTTLKRFLDSEMLQIANDRFYQRGQEDQNDKGSAPEGIDHTDVQDLLANLRQGWIKGADLESHRALFGDPTSATFEELMNAVRECVEPSATACCLVHISGWLQGEARTALIAEAMGLLETTKLSSDAFHSKTYTMATIVDHIAPHLNQTQLLEAFDMAWSFAADDIHILETFLPHLAEQMKHFDFRADRTWSRNRLIIPLLFGPVDIARRLAPSDEPVVDMLGHETAIFKRQRPRLDNESKGLRLIRALIPYLADELVDPVWNYILYMPSPHLRAEAAIEVALAKNGSLRDASLRLAFEALPDCDPSEWGKMIERVAPILDHDQAEQALRLAKSLPDPAAKATALASIEHAMPPHLRPQTLAARLTAVSQLPRRVSFPICARTASDLGARGHAGAAPELAERIASVLAWWR